MTLKISAGTTSSDNRFAEELTYLYKRLSTVNDLIRTLEQYDRLRPKPAELPIREKTA
jgi:hypothetical protein